jgi:hypothetical protein
MSSDRAIAVPATRADDAPLVRLDRREIGGSQLCGGRERLGLSVPVTLEVAAQTAQ